MQNQPTADHHPTASAMPAIAAAALLGGPLTALLLWKHGAFIALLAAPFGGSAAGFAAALVFAAIRYGFVFKAVRRISPSEPAVLHP